MHFSQWTIYCSTYRLDVLLPVRRSDRDDILQINSEIMID